ncbi:GTPase HflX [Croceimicrobium hydrocarbonivorans]|uniref:GTPase HflX n=1 Tax=Croceimicrobium hydrocarbonivorans TaxID=2761580 RepID=A0A7H0VI96_9FLAO|nr:GTPase HflX [Croceimicrobium hydrocarbonivorans]QNR25444.1 GTPase HflX [Croceimicrobium hydrocarbonivorans]
MIETKKKRTDLRERAVLIGVITTFQSEEKVAEYLDELAFLADTAGADSMKRFTQKLDSPNPKTFLGSGKIEEIAAYIKAEDIDLAIFDDELSPSQLKNVERIFEIKVLDRTNLILDIFAARAQTSYARTQVELAQYQYLLPRLTNMWTHLSKQKGGIGMKGPGEREIETDRRIVRDKISLLKKQLQKIDKQMAIQRSNRASMVRVALVGYTNVGKSTLMNLLSKSEVFAENKLFATLDTTVRKVVIHNLPFLMSDTVGFIRKLPTQLVESFKSTLDEVREADVLLHVVDISHPNFEDHISTVDRTIAEIDGREKPTIMIFNKIDAYVPEHRDPDDLQEPENNRHLTLEEWKSTWFARTDRQAIFISATEKENIEDLRNRLYETLAEIHARRYPNNNFLF